MRTFFQGSHTSHQAIIVAFWILSLNRGSAFVVRKLAASRPQQLACHAHAGRLTSVLLQESTLQEIDQIQGSAVFSELCEAAEILPADTMRLDESMQKDGSVVRGVYLSRHVSAGEVILSVPLSACLRCDEPPEWFDCDVHQGDGVDDSTNPCLIAGYYNPRHWATRLAASLIDAQLSAVKDRATELWLSLLPNPDFLRASLPIHWSTPILQSACCTALEVQVDSAFFTRAQALQDLMEALPRHPGARHLDQEQQRCLCEDALDVVQTRSCRVVLSSSQPEVDPPLRLLAPVFDFVNHPSRGRANAEFVLQDTITATTSTSTNNNNEERLVVRALRSMDANEEILIDYGDSTRPASRCLASYGFVPSFDGGDGDGDDDERVDPLQHVAEVYIDGSRYEVGHATIPEDIVLAMTETQLEDVTLTPEIAIRLASRLSDVAYHLLLDPLGRSDEDEFATESPEVVLSSRLAASLRWNQHRVLLACALGLRDWAIDPSHQQND